MKPSSYNEYGRAFQESILHVKFPYAAFEEAIQGNNTQKAAILNAVIRQLYVFKKYGIPAKVLLAANWPDDITPDTIWPDAWETWQDLRYYLTGEK